MEKEYKEQFAQKEKTQREEQAKIERMRRYEEYAKMDEKKRIENEKKKKFEPYWKIASALLFISLCSIIFFIFSAQFSERPIRERTQTILETRGGTERQMRRDARAILELVEGKSILELLLDTEFLAKKIALNQKYTGTNLVMFERILREEMIAMFGEHDDDDILILFIIAPF